MWSSNNDGTTGTPKPAKENKAVDVGCFDSIFLKASPFALEELFRKLYQLATPHKEEMFVSWCLSNSRGAYPSSS
jgi:hypothetical protein